MRSLRGGLALAALAALPAALPAFAQSAPLPRYASLRFETVHVRSAPTEDAPIRRGRFCKFIAATEATWPRLLIGLPVRRRWQAARRAWPAPGC